MRYILTDIEGTTTDIAFVHNVLFPYSTANLVRFLSKNVDIQHQVVAKMAAQFREPFSTERAIAQLLEWVAEDKKEPILKDLQGEIWADGYQKGTLVSHIYDDVLPALQRWHAEGIGIGIYSSGSVKAQVLLFGHTEYGDLNHFFSHYFDTRYGHKQHSQSYRNILDLLKKDIDIEANDILFLSDVEKELDAATNCGFQTCQLVREGTIASERHRVVKNFNKII